MRHAVISAIRNGASCHATGLELRRHYADLRGYVCNNQNVIVDYHRRYNWLHPVSTSRAEGYVDEIANARTGKRQRMRWSPSGAHNVAVVRAAVLDQRLETALLTPEAA